MSLTEAQKSALGVIARGARHTMLYGGSRSGKTYLLIKCLILRAIKAQDSRHACFRHTLNACRSTVVGDTLPRVLRNEFEGLETDLSKTDLVLTIPSGSSSSSIVFGGLDESDRVEKILGSEYVTLYFNECSQIPLESRDTALTRLAQLVEQEIAGERRAMAPRAFYDCNPPSKDHWTYRLFIEKRDPSSKIPVRDPNSYEWFKLNPEDNRENVAPEYLDSFRDMSARHQRRFWLGEFEDSNPEALFRSEDVDRWRCDPADVPQLIRVVVGIDPSGASDGDPTKDAIGIVAGGLGIDGNAYLLEDATLHAGPAAWGRVAGTVYDRHGANAFAAEANYGGGMVQHVIQTAKPGSICRLVTASRGKAVRAEPFAALYEQGKIRHAGRFMDLEDEMADFGTHGYTGTRSPNRADAWFWVLADLFGAIVTGKKPGEAVFTPSPLPNLWR